MKNRFLIILLIVLVLSLSFIIYDQITGKLVLEKGEEFSCIYRHKQGINELPLEECCRSIKGFLKCEEIEGSINNEGKTIEFNRVCYNNREGELGIFFGEEVWNYCENKNYI